MESKQNLHTILGLKMVIEETIFKNFMRNYNLPDGLNKSQLMAMVILTGSGPLSMSSMSHRMNMEKGSFTTVANKLIKLEYITSQRSQKDKRVYELQVTEKGKKIADVFTSAHSDYFDDLFAELSDEKREAFFEAIDLVAKTIVDVSSDDFKMLYENKMRRKE